MHQTASSELDAPHLGAAGLPGGSTCEEDLKQARMELANLKQENVELESRVRQVTSELEDVQSRLDELSKGNARSDTPESIVEMPLIITERVFDISRKFKIRSKT